MWELSIVIDCKKSAIAKFIYQTLKDQTADLGSIVTCFEDFGDINILFACPEEEQTRASVIVERCIIKTISIYYKEEFLKNNLVLPLHEEMSLMAFQKALVNFDKETDFYLISKSLSLGKTFYVDSFFDFRLRGLQNKWAELISLANENSECLVSSDAFFDLLKFLIDNLEVCEDEIDVFEDEAGFFISEKNKFEDLQKTSLSNEGLVSSLIELCPKKINLFCKGENKTASFLSKIFEERINVCYNKNLEQIENFGVMK